MRCKIRIETGTQAQQFANLASKVDGKVLIKDSEGLCVNGKSILGALHALEFSELWCETDVECYAVFRDFIVD